MTSTIKKIVGFSVLAAATMFAQTPASGTGQRHAGPREHLQKMAQELGLTADQQAQAQDIFRNAFAASRPVRQQMRDARKQLQADAKAGATEDVLSKDGAQVGALAGQLAAARAKAFEQFYSILNADQKAKLDSMKGKRAGGFRSRG